MGEFWRIVGMVRFWGWSWSMIWSMEVVKVVFVLGSETEKGRVMGRVSAYVGRGLRCVKRRRRR